MRVDEPIVRGAPAAAAAALRLLAAVASALWLVAASASAHGGLLAPAGALDQPRGRVVLTDHGDGRQTAIVELSYDGTAERFAWVIPVPGVPEIALSSSTAIDRLQVLTDPVYGAEGFPHGTCLPQETIAAVGPPYPEGTRSVAVYDAGEVGPFDYRVIGADGDAEDPAGALMAWLGEAGVDAGSLDDGLLQRYVDDGFNLLVVGLRKDHDAGELRPLALTYEADRLLIPLELAAGTAAREVQLFVWVLGQAATVPSNWPTLELNDTRIDFFDPNPGYPALVAEAVREAGGRGFVDEYAGSTAPLASNFTLIGREQWEAFQMGGFDATNTALIDATTLIFGEWDGYEQAIRDNAPGSEDVPREELLRCPSCYVDDVEAFALSLSRDVVEPMLIMHDQLRAAPHITRFNAVMDGADMTLDPTFAYLRETAVESNVRRARGSVRCDDRFDLELPFGNLVTGFWGQWPQEAGDLPATRRILQYDDDGEVEVLEDNRAAIAEVFPAPDAPAPSGDGPSVPPLLDGGVEGDGGAQREPGRGGSCSAARGDGASSGAPLWVLAFALVLRRASRRRRD